MDEDNTIANGQNSSEEEWLERFMSVIRESFGDKFAASLLNKMKQPPKFISLEEVFAKEYGVLDCIIEHYFSKNSRSDFYVISQETSDSRRIQAVLMEINRRASKELSACVGHGIRIRGAMCEQSRGALRTYYDSRISSIEVIGKKSLTTPRHLRLREAYFAVSGYVVDISWNYSNHEEDFWLYITLSDMTSEVTITSRGGHAHTLKEALEEFLGEDLGLFNSRQEYISYKLDVLSKIMYLPVKVASERYMKCSTYEKLRLKMFESKQGKYEVVVNEVTDEEVLGDTPEGVYEHGALGQIVDVEDYDIPYVIVNAGGESLRIAVHPEGAHEMSTGDRVAILYRSSTSLELCTRGEGAALTDRVYNRLLREYSGDVTVLRRIMAMPRIRTLL